ncbi:MAG: hypothetical protein ACE5PT_12330 [Gemmatimonadales bacterium]
MRGGIDLEDLGRFAKMEIRAIRKALRVAEDFVEREMARYERRFGAKLEPERRMTMIIEMTWGLAGRIFSNWSAARVVQAQQGGAERG